MLDPLAIDGIAAAPQHPRHAPRAQDGPRRAQLIDLAHQRLVIVVGEFRRPVHARTRQPEKLALPADRQHAVRAVEPGSAGSLSMMVSCSVKVAP